MKSYCTLFTRLKNYFPPAYLSFFFFFFFFSFCTFFLSLPSLFLYVLSALHSLLSVLSALPSVLHRWLGFSIDFGNGLRFGGLVAWETGLGFLLIFETGLGLPVGNGLGGGVVDRLRFAGCMSCIAYVIMHCVLLARKPR
jgi:hypothetical protein